MGKIRNGRNIVSGFWQVVYSNSAGDDAAAWNGAGVTDSVFGGW